MEEQLPIEELRDLVRQLSNTSKCAVCLEPLRQDLIMCDNGHVICRECKWGQIICPTCRASFTHIKPTFIRQIVEILPHICRYDGCNTIVRKNDDHELYCGFQMISCKNCNDCVKASSLLKHHQEIHPRLTCLNAGVRLISKFYPNHSNQKILLFSVHGNEIWHTVNNNVQTGMFTHTFQVVPNRKVTCDLYAVVIYRTVKNEHITSIKLNTNPNIDEEKENCIIVPNSILHNYYEATRNNNLSYNVQIHKKSTFREYQFQEGNFSEDSESSLTQ